MILKGDERTPIDGKKTATVSAYVFFVVWEKRFGEVGKFAGWKSGFQEKEVEGKCGRARKPQPATVGQEEVRGR